MSENLRCWGIWESRIGVGESLRCSWKTYRRAGSINTTKDQKYVWNRPWARSNICVKYLILKKLRTNLSLFYVIVHRYGYPSHIQSKFFIDPLAFEVDWYQIRADGIRTHDHPCFSRVALPTKHTFLGGMTPWSFFLIVLHLILFHNL